MKIEVKLIVDISKDSYRDIEEAKECVQYAISDPNEVFLHSNLTDTIGEVVSAELISIQ